MLIYFDVVTLIQNILINIITNFFKYRLKDLNREMNKINELLKST